MKTLTKLVVAAALLAPSIATADTPPEQPTVPQHGAGGGEGHAPEGAGHGDPTEHFNWTEGLDLSYKSKDVTGGKLDQGEEHMSVPFVLVLFNFGLLLLFLGWKAGPIARQMAAKRSDDIKRALDEAAHLRNQAKTKLDEYNGKLRAAEAEIDQMIRDMRADAEADRQRIIAAAEQQAAALKKDAEERIAAEIERARAQLQREVVAAAATVAEQQLREKTTPSDHAKLVDNFIREVAS